MSKEKGYAVVWQEESRFYGEEIEVRNELIVGDFIRYFPDSENEEFTASEIDDGVMFEVVKRVYSTIDGMLYYCKDE
jgi:hypothetical protein|tara:strand:- start:14 stop:244 length:231 start_codon:yes stop_codon:yes gene_type:complete